MVAEKKLTPAQLAKLEDAKRKEAEVTMRAYEKNRMQRKENGVRMVVLRERVKLIDTMYKLNTKKTAQDDKDKSWQRYVDCENKPYGDRPAQLREYLSKWEWEMEDEVKRFFDWQLNIDERTMLDQSPFRVDRSERQLRSLQPPLAPPFYDKIQDALKVLDELNDVLATDHTEKHSKRNADIKVVRENFQKYIWTYLDYMTHIIAGNIDREMKMLSPIDAQYTFKSEIFSMGIFTHRAVPLCPLDADSELVEIEFDSMNMKLRCPHTMSFDGSAMRVLWFAFDHYSDYAPSNTIEVDPMLMQRNLLQSCRQEWDKRENMELLALSRMRQERADYEAQQQMANDPLQRAKAEAEAKAKNGKGGKGKDKPEKKGKKGKGKKGGKEKKAPEPPVVTETTTVNMTEAFLVAEEAKHQKRMQKIHPDVGLLLKPGELNLRHFKVVGGTFALHYLQRPNQFKQFANHIFQRTYQLPDNINYNHYYVPFKRYHFDSTCSLNEAQRDHILKQENNDFELLLEVTVQLPDKVCWWHEPQVVRWQPWEESPEFLELRDDLKHFNLHFDQIELQKSLRLFNILHSKNRHVLNADLIEDFNLAQRTEDIRLFYILTKYIVPKLSLSYRFECELREEEERLAMELKRREHLKREHEEDLRVMQETKELRRKQREMGETGSKQSSDALLLSRISSRIDSERNSVTSDGRPHSLIEHPELPPIVHGLAARELFPNINESVQLQLEPSVQRPNADSIMLSQLINSIELYNHNELPIFKEKKKPFILPPTPELSEPPSERNSIDPGKPSRKKSMATSNSMDLNSRPSMPALSLEPKGLHLVEHHKGKWINEGIHVVKYDSETKLITFRTTNIGIFGLAQDKYIHFPFQSWELLPNYEEIPMSVRFKINAQHISLELVITAEGFKLTIVRPKPAFCPVKEPLDVLTLKQLIRFMKDANLNIFPDNDAYWYVTNEEKPDETIFSYKHEPMANHTYQAMAVFCQTHQFKHSPWNRLGARRQVFLLCRQIVEGRNPEALLETQITPTDAYFVRAEERCTALTELELDVRKTPVEQDFSCDVFDLLDMQSIEKSKKRQANTHNELKWNVAELLRAVQPLSYS